MTPRRTELDDVEVRSENRKGAAGAAVRPPGPGRVTRVRCPPRTTAGVCPGGTARCSGHPGVRGRTPRRWRCAPCASCAAARAADSHPGRKYSRERNTAARTLNAIGEISRSVTEEMRHRSRDPRNGGSSRAGRHAESGWPCHPPGPAPGQPGPGGRGAALGSAARAPFLRPATATVLITVRPAIGRPEAIVRCHWRRGRRATGRPCRPVPVSSYGRCRPTGRPGSWPPARTGAASRAPAPSPARPCPGR